MNMWIPYPPILFTLASEALYIYLESGYMTKESVEREKRSEVFELLRLRFVPPIAFVLEVANTLAFLFLDV